MLDDVVRSTGPRNVFNLESALTGEINMESTIEPHMITGSFYESVLLSKRVLLTLDS